MKRALNALALAVLLALPGIAPARAATATPKTTTSEDAVTAPGQSRVASRLATNYLDLTGSKENSLSLVNALRNGGSVTLTTHPAGGTGDPVTTTFEVPTGKMGWGNVSHALALARTTLAQAGITNPTPEQLQAALVGGDVTAADGSTVTLKGILTMRADGMGWGGIAKASGTTLGAAVSSAKGMQPRATTTTSTASGTDTAAAKRSGVVTATGSSAGGASSAKGLTTAAGTSATHGSRGLVTADGAVASPGRSGGVTTAAGAGSGNGNAYGRGIVTASGGSAGAGAAAAANGRGAGITSAAGASVSSSGAVTAASGGGNGGGHGNAGGHGGGNGNGQGKGR